MIAATGGGGWKRHPIAAPWQFSRVACRAETGGQFKVAEYCQWNLA
jgi:hypothetical protein